MFRCILTHPLSPFLSLLSEFPTIANEQERVDYKREFDRDHQEYKDLQGELDIINKSLSEVDRELDELQEGSPQFLVSLMESFW
jgi:occludin